MHDYFGFDFRMIGRNILNLSIYCNEANNTGNYETNNSIILDNYKKYRIFFVNGLDRKYISTFKRKDRKNLFKELNIFENI